MSKINYSIVTTVYNDGFYAQEFCNEIINSMSEYLGVSKKDIHKHIEIIIINDGSRDESLSLLKKVKKKCKPLKIVDLSRNFGQHSALSCGYKIAKGNYIIRNNIDLQDPVYELPKMLDFLKRSNSDVVVGYYKKRKSNFFVKLTSFLYFMIFNFMTGLKINPMESSLRVMSRRFINSHNELNEKVRFPQGLDNWIGFKQSNVIIQHRKNKLESSYNFHSRLNLGIKGLIYFSDRPLIFIGIFGFLLAFIGIIYGAINIYIRFTSNYIIPGYASTICILALGFGIQFIFMGLLGIYLGQIFREVKDRPLYIIRSIIE